MKRTLLVAFAAIAFSAATASAGPILAGTPSGQDYYENIANGMLGFEFTSNYNLSVVQLGIWDYNIDGLVDSHAVGLWDSDANLIASVTIPNSTSATLLNGYRWVTVAASLSAGSNYILGAFYPGYTSGVGGDYFRLTAPIDPHFTLVSDRILEGPSVTGLMRPTGTADVDGFFGPNLRVPDGGTTLALLGGALLGLGALRRKFRG